MSPNAILEFILNLLRDHEAAANYCTNPAQSLADAGLGSVTPEDITAVAPMVAESALVAGGSQLSAICAAGAGADTGAGLNGNLEGTGASG